MSTYRAAIVGAGPAGLAAALTLTRSMQPTLVVDPGNPARNAASPGVGGLLRRDLVASRLATR
jgi:flavin-dependent dehydrogenase